MIPDKVIEVFNDLISRYFIKNSATFTRQEVTELICYKLKCCFEDIRKGGWLNIEDIYTKAGWQVEYIESSDLNKPLFPFFRFTKI